MHPLRRAMERVGMGVLCTTSIAVPGTIDSVPTTWVTSRSFDITSVDLINAIQATTAATFDNLPRYWNIKCTTLQLRGRRSGVYSSSLNGTCLPRGSWCPKNGSRCEDPVMSIPHDCEDCYSMHRRSPICASFSHVCFQFPINSIHGNGIEADCESKVCFQSFPNPSSQCSVRLASERCGSIETLRMDESILDMHRPLLSRACRRHG